MSDIAQEFSMSKFATKADRNEAILAGLDQLRADNLALALQVKALRDALTLIEYGEARNGCILSLGEASSIATEALILTGNSTAIVAAHDAEALHQMAHQIRLMQPDCNLETIARSVDGFAELGLCRMAADIEVTK